MAVTTRNIYWTAGFLEAEGSFLFGKDGTLKVVAVQVQSWPLERLANLYGGKVYLETRSNPKWNDVHRWYVIGERAAGLMMTLYPLMMSKRKRQILAALDGWKKEPVPRKYRTHCPNGHERTEENIYLYRNVKQCRQCRKIQDQGRGLR